MENEKYNANQDFCPAAKEFQSVPSREQYRAQHPKVDPKDYDTNRVQTLYSCPDNYQMGTIQDNQIYIATTDPQHDQIAKGEHVDAHGGLSGYFSDQATVDACKNGDNLDNTKYNEACQIAPHRDGGLSGEGDAQYKPHLDCFDIDRNALYKNYGTYDFNAAIAKCEANNQFGSGGGNQGYNPYISEMIDNGTLKYNPNRSYSDRSISKSEHNNHNNLTNSVVDEGDYKAMMRDAQSRSKDCVKNNTPHPSSEACNNGFNKNDAIDVGCNTGNATPVPEQQATNTHNPTVLSGELSEPQQPASNNNSQISGTLPNQAQDIELPNNQADGKSGKDLAEIATKKNGGSFDPNNAIS